MSNFMKKALDFFSPPKSEKKKLRQTQKETGSILGTGQPQETETTQTGKRKEEETKEMKIKDKGKLFVGGLDPATTTQSLKAYFTKFGSVVDAVVMRFPDSKKSRGYGFVTFADPVNAECALTVKSHIIDGKPVDIRPFESSRSESKSRKRNQARVFLGGLPLDTNEEDLKNFFSRYGKVSELFLPLDRKTNKPKGYAFLSFEEKQAAERCLSESSLHLGNKRVVIKKASARSGSTETMSDIENGVECLDLESAAGCEDDALSLRDDDDGQSSASGGRTSLFEQYPGFLKVLENYLQPKIALYDSANKMERKEEDPKWQPPVRDTQEMEKLLARFLIKSSRPGGDTFSDEDVTDDDDDDDVGDWDCNDSEESVIDEEEDDNDDSVYEDDNVLFEKGSVLDLLSEELKKTLLAKTTEGKIGNFKSSIHENESIPTQKPSLLFTVKDKAGSWKCSLCQWTPPDGLRETFLAHCNTPGHKMKTKERFMSENVHAVPETRLNRIQEGPSERQNKIQILQEQGKKKLPSSDEQMPQQVQKQKKKQQQCNQQIPRQPQPQQQKKKKTQQQQPGQQIPQQQKNQQQPGQQTSQKSQQGTKKKMNQNSENPSENGKMKNGKKIPNLKIHALAKGMVCIQPVSPNELRCKMCNKAIPKAPDFGTLMKNVSCHLQSKRHLNKLAATENSLKSALDNHPEEPVQARKKNENGIMAEATGGKKEQGPAQKGPPKGKNPPGSGNNCDYKTQKGAPAAAAAVPKVNFLCLSCNYFANKQETFNAHLSSKVHLESVNKTNTKSIQFGENSVLCKGCNRYLWGSLYDINKHNSKCSK